MLYTPLLFLAITGYLLATLFIGRAVRLKDVEKEQPRQRAFNFAFVLAACSTVGHGVYAAKLNQFGAALDFSLSSMTVLVSAILVLIYLLGSLAMPIKRLGILVFPLTATSLVFSYFWNSDASYLVNHGGAFGAHILISILAYSFLSIAAIQALLYVYQERQIKNHTTPSMLMALPPLQTMEVLLFRLVGVGFLFLTLTLLSGALFSQQIFGQPFEFKHHTILALMGWGVFAALLFKRFKNGLRGSQAVTWTIIGFLLIQLGYFGTKIVTESMNIQ